MVDHSNMKLGKLRARTDSRVPRMASILDSIVPAAPAAHKWSGGRTDWTNWANDTLGDCTSEGVFHLEMIAAQETRRAFKPAKADVVGFYYASTGQKPPSDNGGVELDVLNYWLKNPILDRSLVGHATVDPTNLDHVKQGAFLFPGLYLGVALPITAQTQDVWDTSPLSDFFNWKAKPGSWGGHCVQLVDYDADGPTFITWGALKKATWRWFQKYCDEAHAVLPAAWIQNQLSPGGINVRLLQDYMTEL